MSLTWMQDCCGLLTYWKSVVFWSLNSIEWLGVETHSKHFLYEKQKREKQMTIYYTKKQVLQSLTERRICNVYFSWQMHLNFNRLYWFLFHLLWFKTDYTRAGPHPHIHTLVVDMFSTQSVTAFFCRLHTSVAKVFSNRWQHSKLSQLLTAKSSVAECFCCTTFSA